MLSTRSFSRFRKISSNRFPSDTHIKHNEVYVESICKEIQILNNTKKENATELKRWSDSLEKYLPYWVVKLPTKRIY